MKKYISLLVSILFVLTSCEHKELCLDHEPHALKYHVQVNPTWRTQWYENLTNLPAWESNWPSNYIPYESLIPAVPTGLRVVNITADYNKYVSNISPQGGTVFLTEGENDLLFYNNDTEYIVFTDMSDLASAMATTRTKTRASYGGNPFATSADSESTVNPPDMLYANYIADYIPEKVQEPAPFNVTLHPLVFTYKIRYEFEEGLEYVSLARGALSGMAIAVNLSTGQTSDEIATILYDCEIADYGARALVNSFGVPSYPNGSYSKGEPSYGLNLEVRLRNGTMMSFNFDVTDQIKAQPHGGVIVVSGIAIKEEEGMAGSGGFDVDISDWGEYNDITIPL